MSRVSAPEPESSLRERLYVVIFEHDTRGGAAFDVTLLLAIVLSVVAVILESVDEARHVAGAWLRLAEWMLTVVFSIEYGLRLYCARSRSRYALSFFGVVDLIAVLPTFASVLIPGAQSLLVVRVLRLLRVFRVLKLVSFHGEADALWTAVRRSMRKIIVFVGTVLSIVVIVGALMHFIEGSANGFTNIPRSMYWAIVTLTTVGYGDIAPQTPMGQTLAAMLMVLGYGIIAVPTGIVSAEMVRAGPDTTTEALPPCASCGATGARADARYCRRCGAPRTEPKAASDR